ncbi:hypothetical protein [Chryseobacterium jejuense]|uniref:hypothetical protein n=1 Tax=Chryseobacterium jejuense TaxID=445960 RepID=UPI001AE5018A|nr:hypothetical protein [Chryseobacterium jejuense]MBP2618610.1 hypothetical protein [Chryseobacterium jejuense]
MKKNGIVPMIFLSCSSIAFGQTITAGSVGIGITEPKSTLHIEGKAGSASVPDGLTVPRLTRAQLSAKNNVYTSDQNGTLVFVTTLDGAAIDKVVNVTSVGLYFYDAPTNKWYNVRYSSFGVVESLKVITGTYSPAAPYVVQPDDYILLLRFSTASTGGNSTANINNTAPFINTTSNLQLPDPTTCPGRVLHFINDSDRFGTNTGANVYTNYPMISNGSGSEPNAYNIRSNNNNYQILYGLNYSQWKIISDGTRWISLQVVIV